MKKHIYHHTDKSKSSFYYLPNFLNKIEQENILKYLEKMNDFYPCKNYQDKNFRYQKWYQKDKKYFNPHWKIKYKRWESFNYDTFLINLEKKISLVAPQIKINSCLINKYINGDNYISRHRDSKTSFGEYPNILILSIGSTRSIVFNRLKSEKLKPEKISFPLESGSIFIMTGSSQKFFVHEIPKTKTQKIRYSLTFRNFIL